MVTAKIFLTAVKVLFGNYFPFYRFNKINCYNIFDSCDITKKNQIFLRFDNRGCQNISDSSQVSFKARSNQPDLSTFLELVFSPPPALCHSNSAASISERNRSNTPHLSSTAPSTIPLRCNQRTRSSCRGTSSSSNCGSRASARTAARYATTRERR